MVEFTPELNAALSQLLEDYPDIPIEDLSEFQLLLTQGDDLVESFPNFPFTLPELQSIVSSITILPVFLRESFDEIIARYVMEFPDNAMAIWMSIRVANNDGTVLEYLDATLSAILNTPSLGVVTRQEILTYIQDSNLDAAVIDSISNSFNSSNRSSLESASSDLQQVIFLYQAYEPAFSQVISRLNSRRILEGMESAKQTLDEVIAQLSA